MESLLGTLTLSICKDHLGGKSWGPSPQFWFHSFSVLLRNLDSQTSFEKYTLNEIKESMENAWILPNAVILYILHFSRKKDHNFNEILHSLHPKIKQQLFYFKYKF